MLIIVIMVCFAIAYFIGGERKIGFGWSLAACIFLSPVIGLIITLCSEKLDPREESVAGSNEEKLKGDVLSGSEQSSMDLKGRDVASTQCSLRTSCRLPYRVQR